MTGNITYAAEAGAELGLPSCNALPALALAQEMVLEAALLNTFLASTAVQIEREKTTSTSREKNNWHVTTPPSGHKVGMAILSK